MVVNGGLKAILESFGALVSKWPVTAKLGLCLATRYVGPELGTCTTNPNFDIEGHSDLG